MLLARFFKDTRGATVPLLALALVPLMGGVGAAIDYTRASAARASMQSALDATGLMLSKEVKGMGNVALQSRATEVFNALFTDSKATNVSVNAVLTQPGDGMFNLKITGTGTVPTVFSAYMGYTQTSIGSTTEVTWGMKKLNLALALDNTGSMDKSSKMVELKKAAKNLLTTLQNAERVPGDIKISIVPFAVDVNVGSDKAGETWIDWTDWDKQNGRCSNNNYDTYNSCVNANRTWTPSNHSSWNGCVKDRDQNDDVLNTPPGTSAATKYRAHQAADCPTAMMTLSSSWTDLNSKIDAMAPAGNTNVTIGMQLAWQTLSNNAPFLAPAPAPDLDKVIILLTDGQNTQNRWSQTTSAIDARTEKVCANIKADNIKLYTVRVIDGNATLLKTCASQADMYYDVDQAAELNTVFSVIAQKLATLRLSK